MAKNDFTGCPSCAITNYGFGGRGDGKCSPCWGKGQIYGFTDAFQATATFGMAPDHHKCKICSGTGQCQRCGGTGYIHFNKKVKKEKKYKSSYSSESYDYKTPAERKAEHRAYIRGSFIGFIVLSVIVIVLINTCGTGKKSTSYANNSASTVVQSNQPSNYQSTPCEENHTGEIIFRNPTDHRIYIFITSGVWSKNIVVAAGKSVSYEIPANEFPYDYKFSYFKNSDFPPGNFEGRTEVSQCSRQDIDLIIPEYLWYPAEPEQWIEVNINPDKNYSVVLQNHPFSVRFFEEDSEHRGVSHGPIPYGTSKVFLKHSHTSVLDFAIVEVQ